MDNLPFFDLFLQLRDAGMALTPEQYDWLRQALDKGYGFYGEKGWDDLKRLCRLLWVKPCANYDGEMFDRIFDAYVRQQGEKLQVLPEPPPIRQNASEKTSEDSADNLPRVPPRRMPSRDTAEPPKVPVAVKVESPRENQRNNSQRFQLTPTDLPISTASVRVTWNQLRRPVAVGGELELDLAATIDRIQREGLFGDVVLRPHLARRGELLLLVDDNNAMVPFFPALQPLICAIEERRISPAQIYRFTRYPERHLYHWHRPARAEPLDRILSRLHRYRTVAIIVSEAGAAMGTHKSQHVARTIAFLERLSPCIRQLVWVNPLPPERWRGTSAGEIDRYLGGGMVGLDNAKLKIRN